MPQNWITEMTNQEPHMTQEKIKQGGKTYVSKNIKKGENTCIVFQAFLHCIYCDHAFFFSLPWFQIYQSLFYISAVLKINLIRMQDMSEPLVSQFQIHNFITTPVHR